MQLKPFDIHQLAIFYPLLRTAFPENELIPIDYHKKMFSRPNFYGRQYNDFSAFIIGYQFSEYLFLELFMVQEHLRNQGIGKAFLEEIMKESKTPIILEVEHPTDQLTQRRIGFYERLGFHLNISDYKMPIFDENHGGVPLYLMSYPRKLNQSEIDDYTKKLHKEVYLIE